jgi:hypothetical protein
MGLVRLVAGHQQKVGFASTASIVGPGRETVYGPTDRSAIVLWIGSEALCLGSSGHAQLC